MVAYKSDPPVKVRRHCFCRQPAKKCADTACQGSPHGEAVKSISLEFGGRSLGYYFFVAISPAFSSAQCQCTHMLFGFHHDAMDARGDMEGWAVWLRIGKAIDALASDSPAPAETIHCAGSANSAPSPVRNVGGNVGFWKLS